MVCRVYEREYSDGGTTKQNADVFSVLFGFGNRCNDGGSNIMTDTHAEAERVRKQAETMSPYYRGKMLTLAEQWEKLGYNDNAVKVPQHERP
jgi:hypothetical protein